MIVPVTAAGYYNLFTWAFDTTAKTLTFSNVIGFDPQPSSLISIWNSTHSAFMPQIAANVTSPVTIVYVAGLPTYVFTFTAIPAGWSNGDTLVIRLEIPDSVANYTVLAYIASKS